jgi:nucleotide-binding universal stress UspA family protein
MLASEGRPFSNQAIALATRLSERSGAPVHVLAIARIWGTSFGFPNPGLYPNKGEWDERRSMVQRVVWGLDRKGIEADGHVIGARNATKRITREARRLGCDAIVMATDEPRNRFLGSFMWSQEPQRVRRRADVPVFLVSAP